MNQEGSKTYKRRVFIVLLLLVVFPILASILPVSIVGPVRDYISQSTILLFPAASYTSFSEIAELYYFFDVISISIQQVIVIWYAIRIPIERLEFLREIYEVDEKWLSFGGFTLLRRKWGMLFVCAVFFIGTLAAIFYLGPGFGIRNSRGLTEVFMFFTMNSAGMVSLMLYTGLFAMWSRLIHSNRDI